MQCLGKTMRKLQWRLLLCVWLALLNGKAWADLEPIRIGAMTSSGGSVPISESIDGLKAYIEQVNQAGGIHGRKLQLLWVDDNGDPARARELGRYLVENERVLALVGGASTVECAANADYYARSGLLVIPGTGVEDACFNSSAIAPVNAGPYVGLGGGLKFASETLGAQKICAVLLAIKGMEQGFKERIEAWTRATGKKLHGAPIPYDPTAPESLVLQEIEHRGCDSVVFVGLEKATLAILTSPVSPALKAMDWIFMTPAYTANVARLDTKGWKGVYAMSEFMPWTSADMAVRDWKEKMNQKRTPLSSFSQGGYVAGQVFVEMLRRIRGDISRESIRKQALLGEGMENSMLGAPFVFGSGTRHNPNRQVIPVRLQEKAWRVAYFNWLTLD